MVHHAKHLLLRGDHVTQKIWSAAIIAAALCAAPVATAQSNNCADLENPKKLQNLEYEKQLELYGDCPLEKIYTSEAILSEWKLSHVDRKLIREMLQSQTVELLMHFRYGLYGEDGTVNDDAMREFQASRGEPATGTLTLRQADDLRKMEQTLLKKPSNVWLYGGTITFEKEDKPKVTMVGNSLFIEGSR